MPGLIALSMHKAGSSIADQILEQICLAHGMTVDHMAKAASRSPLYLHDYFVEARVRLSADATYFGIIRQPADAMVADLRALRVVVQLRDPRDCLTSAYFSFGQSHRVPDDPGKRARFLARRAAIQAEGIDAYVLREATHYVRRMEVLDRIVTDHPAACLVTYEEMVERTEAWLARVAGFVGQPVDDALRARLGRRLDFTPPPQDTPHHRRQVRPGDHARKLTPETVAALTEQLGPGMRRFGYAV